MDNNTQVLSTTNYDQFSFMGANRDTNRGHVEALKRAFEEVGNLTRVQPILVNDQNQIIDGQHRFTAAAELGEPVFYTVAPGLGVNEARSMNVLHKTWRTPDYAKSYAATGDPSYQRYNKLKEDYGYNHSVILSYTSPSGAKGSFKAFREGQYTLSEADYQAAKERLDKLADVVEIVPLATTKAFALAMLRAMRTEGYNHGKMLQKLKSYPEVKQFAGEMDNARQLEAVYNWHVQTNFIRFL